jgi:pimeloyl-ACP methyl ester carboxylesterase
MNPFRIEVGDDVLTDLRERLGRTRWPNQLRDAGWDYGTELGYLQDLCAYWADGYDWRAHEARLNGWEQFVTEIDGQRIHFLHARSPREDALPLLMMHGWPGSIVEFIHVIDRLRDPAAHGGDAADAFHVICPSLPGYGFSGPTAERGWNPARMARAFAELMSRLGYERYGAQGGDWGASVAAQIATSHARHVCGLHLNLVMVGMPPDFDLSTLSAAEQASLAESAAFFEDGSGYLQIQGTRPQSVGYGLDDSPAGLAAWIAEKFRAWTDCVDENGERELDRAISRDDLLTNITLYWVTRTATSSARLYYEAHIPAQLRGGNVGGGLERIEVPTGCALYPRELLRPPRVWAERAYNVVHWAEMPRGGHFAAFEQPELFSDDVRTFFRTVR